MGMVGSGEIVVGQGKKAVAARCVLGAGPSSEGAWSPFVLQ